MNPIRYQWQEIEHAYYISPDGVEYPLWGGKRALMRFSGLAMPDIRYITDSGPFVHGSRVRDYRLQDRIVEFVPYDRGCSRQTRWNNIGDITATIRPNRGGSGRILVYLPDGTEREIDAWVSSGPSGEYDSESSFSAFDIREVLRFLAPFPVWRDPDQNQEIFTVTISESCLDMCLPACIGDGIVTTGFVYMPIAITYPGTWESYPTVEITGPITYPTIENQTTGKTIELQYIVVAGEKVTITLTPSQAVVKNNFGVDLIGTISNLNDLGSFSIIPESVDAPNGVNDILTVGASAVAGLTAVTITYYDQYLGIPR